MSLIRRLLLGSTVVIVLLVTAIATIAGGRLRDRLRADTFRELTRSARLVAVLWRPGQNADSLADAAGAALDRRVTLIGGDGVVRGDSKFTPTEILGLENHSTRPEVIAARANGVGTSDRSSASAGDEEMYVAVRHPLGFVRVSIGVETLDDTVSAAQRDVLVAGLFGLLGAFLLSWLFARTVSRPVVDLRNVARAVADGDLTRRPSLNAPGEIGDLSAAVHRMTEQLAGRLAALQSEEELMHATIEALDEGIMVVDARNRVVRLNSSARRILGMSDAVPFSADRLPPMRALRECLRSAAGGSPTDPAELELDGRIVALVGRPLPGGGAVLALLGAGAARIDVVNRTQARAEAVAALDSRVFAQGWDGATAALEGADAVINATTLGMEGQPPLELSLEAASRSAVVMDMVYRPLKTGLLRAAEARGHPVADGLSMLIGQAVPSFEAIFGRSPPQDVDVRALCEEALGERGPDGKAPDKPR